MILRRFLLTTFFALWATLSHAQLLLLGVDNGTGGFTPSCSQSTTFLARTSGLSATETSAYDTMICGMVTDGTYSLLDGLYIFATNTVTTAALNLISTSFTATVHGTLTFAADSGWTGNASTGFLDTGFNPATAPSAQWTLNSAHFSTYILNSRTANDAWNDFGATDNTNFILWIPLAGNIVNYDVNDATGGNFANAQAQAMWGINRVSSASTQVFKNGALFGTTASNPATVIPPDNLYVFALNDIGTANSFSGDKLSAVSWGAGLDTTHQCLLANRINGYMTALGINVYTNGTC